MENTRRFGKSWIFALIAVGLTAGLMWQTGRVPPPKVATWADVEAEARAGGYHLITTEELRDRYLADPGGMLLVDTRQEWEYRTGHIRGAVNFSMEPTAWSRWRKAGELETFLGPDKERTIVFY